MAYSIIFFLFAMIGALVTVGVIIAYIHEYIAPKIKSFLARKCKIRFLCNHDYVKKFDFAYGSQITIEIECKNCGKRKEISYREE